MYSRTVLASCSIPPHPALSPAFAEAATRRQAAGESVGAQIEKISWIRFITF